jgi:glucosamine kinase
MVLYLGIDGGGTGCRAAVCDPSGRVLGKGRGGPANITSDIGAARENILAAARAALPGGARLEDLVAVMGLAGANVAGSVAEFTAGLPFARLRVVTDAMTAVAGALRDRDGVVAAIGTGSVFAVQRGVVGGDWGPAPSPTGPRTDDGPIGNPPGHLGQNEIVEERDSALRQIGGWGLVLGDEGSGAWIGRMVLARCLRAVDGFVAMTPLMATVLAEMDGPDGIVAFARDAQPVEFAGLAPRVVGSDDPAALAVMAAGEAEVAAFIALLQGDAPLPVVFLGGLGPVYATRLAGRWAVMEALGTALDGALWLARRGA